MAKTEDMMATGFYHDERCLWHSTGEQALFLPIGGWLQPVTGGGPSENPETKRRFRNLLEVSGLWRQLDVRGAEPVTREDLLRVHEAGYLDRFKALSDAGGGALAEDSPFARGGYEIACLSAGLVRRAVADVLRGEVENAYALSRPPGHHCLPEAAMGFCLLANIPVALEAARAEFGALKVVVLDWDVHHGNGTQAIYYTRGDTLTISLHQENCFPAFQGLISDRGRGAGLGANLNIPLLPGSGHQAYLDAFDLLVEPAIRGFAPDLIVVACGLDANGYDPLARMLAHSGTFRALAARVKALAGDLCGGRLVAAHEGGYSEVMVPFCGLAVVEEFAGIATPVVDPFRLFLEENQPPADMVAFQRARLEAQALAP
jgi:acetoin utilization deacetylase AcuC-like enzyme